MEATAEKSTLPEQRAQKKAARRAAFIQEVGKAVAKEISMPQIVKGLHYLGRATS
jgi:hypothetical protein